MNRRSLSTRLYLMYGIILLPLIIFGFYKNGIQLYNKGFVDVIGMFKPLILISMSVCGTVVGKVLRNYRKEGVISKKTLERCKGRIIESLLLAMVLPINSSPIVIFLITFLSAFFLENSKFNRIALLYIVIQGINVVLGLDSFSNQYETSTILNYDGADLFLGMGVGGICSTSILLILIGLVVLSFNTLYKKDMVFASLITFIILGCVPSMIGGDYHQIFNLIFGYNIFFILIFIAPNLYSSSYTVKGQILSGIIIGVLTYLLTFVTPFNAAMLSVLIVNPLKGIIDRLFVIK